MHYTILHGYTSASKGRTGKVGLLRIPIYHPAPPCLAEVKKLIRLVAQREKERRGKMPCPDKITVKSYLTPNEYETVSASARLARLSLSKYVKEACLSCEITSTVDKEAVLALLKVNADMSRLGGLLKLALGEKAIDRQEANLLLESIKKTKILLNERIKAI